MMQAKVGWRFFLLRILGYYVIQVEEVIVNEFPKNFSPVAA